ncbi:hypothetical protein [Microbispora catharanthi]|uniref:Uncharacterized protein n=1 Tax=Microbispora catharanthi TaxID=1712871 RepID=A0A5N6BJ29_9ACTN|nr:hypothetical protein [Microbispora catharanthi]KAB8180452.1 hypothetical protein FH610_033240 [Microbispora catharanthi]
MISADELVGRRLEQVTLSLHAHSIADEPSLVHMWLHMGGLGPVRFHTAPDDSIELALDQPYGDYDMDEYGRVVVAPAPSAFLMSGFLGQSIRVVRHIVDRHLDAEIGLLLEFDRGRVRVLNLADELVVTDALPDGVSAR